MPTWELSCQVRHFFLDYKIKWSKERYDVIQYDTRVKRHMMRYNVIRDMIYRIIADVLSLRYVQHAHIYSSVRFGRYNKLRRFGYHVFNLGTHKVFVQ